MELNPTLEPTPCSLRFALASGRGSPPALAIMKRGFATTAENQELTFYFHSRL
jgi:hypothetical protein